MAPIVLIVNVSMRRSRALSFLALVTLVVPAAVVTAGPVCASGGLVKGQCCCDDGDDASLAPSTSIDATCCCEIDEAPVGRTVDTATVLSSGAPEPAAPAALATPVYAPAIVCAIVAPPVQARGPPPLRTLLAQHTALLC